MGGKNSKAPAAPDPYKTAAAESQFNRLDTYAPSGGGMRYGYTNADGVFQQGLAPQGMQSAQTLIESPYEKAIRQRVEPASVSLVDRVVTDNITNMPNAPRAKDFSAIAQQLFDAGYARMKPDFERENSRLMGNLQARGIPIGSSAFGDAYRQQQQGVNDAMSQLSTQATSAAGAEQSRQFGLDSASRQGAISELVAAMGGGYNPQSSAPSGQGAGVNYSGLVGQKYEADLAAHNQKQSQKSDMMGTLGSMASTMIMKSDRRAKRDVVAVGRRGPLTLYAFRYIGDGPDKMHLGYMAQEVARFFPEALRRVGSWLGLDYSLLPEV